MNRGGDSDVVHDVLPSRGRILGSGADDGAAAAQRRQSGGAVPMSVADADLMRSLHDTYAPALWGFVLGLVDGDGARAQDVVQETFLRAWRHPQALNSTPESARAWLFTVARRIVIDQWRAAARRPEIVRGVLPEQPVGDRTAEIVERQVVMTALRTLRPEHRQVLVACYYGAATLTDVAQVLEIPVGTVKSRLHHALRAMRSALDELGGAR